MSGNCDGELAKHALDQALARRRPRSGLLHHSDRGSQYTSHAYQLHLEQSGILVSMSRKGNCWDNSVMESFFGTLKDECVGSTVYSSHPRSAQRGRGRVYPCQRRESDAEQEVEAPKESTERRMESKKGRK